MGGFLSKLVERADAPALGPPESIVAETRGGEASKRQHLTDDQRATMAEEEREYLAKKGRERQKAELKGTKGEPGPGRGNKTVETAAVSTVSTNDQSAALAPAPAPVPDPRAKPQAAKPQAVKQDAAKPQASKQPDRARMQAVKAHNVSERKVRDAQEVKKADPKLFDQVKAGEMKRAGWRTGEAAAMGREPSWA